MVHSTEVRAGPSSPDPSPHRSEGSTSPGPRGGARWLLLRLCTSNPFYVISAGLFLAGLWISFGDPKESTNTWALAGGLGGYTLLLAGTAFLLVRYAKVWDDARTVLLLVVLMFLATSVTFDEVLVLDPRRGRLCYILGFLFATLISEGLLRGIRLALPALYRLPYYGILGLFFSYPLYLRQFADEPRSHALMWGLFAFTPIAGILFLTLVPAIRRGADYVRGNGSPWPWPLYPWSLFVFLAVAVAGRSFLLCWSMQLLRNGELLFGPYFLVPFGFALAVLLVEMGVTSGRRSILWACLGMPLSLLLLARFGHRPDPIYVEFLDAFRSRLGGDPVYVTLFAGAVFYAYALARKVPQAAEFLTAALLVLAVVGPDSLRLREFREPSPWPLLAAATVQLALGIRHGASWRYLFGGVILAVGIGYAMPGLTGAGALRVPLAIHALVLACLVIGAVFDDAFARLVRLVGPGLLLAVSLAVLFFPADFPGIQPPWLLDVYPFAMAAVLTGYGLILGHRPSLVFAGVILTGWLGTAGWRGYYRLRQWVPGLDYLTASLIFFGVALGISLAKAGMLRRRSVKAPRARV